VNYVAHALLAPDEPIAVLGNLLGDFAKGPLPGELDPEFAAAVAHHRRIDAFCDRHPAFRRSRQRLFETHSHYAGVIVDVLFDHLLSVEWATYSAESLDDFAVRVYATIEEHRARLPIAILAHADTIVRHDVLRRYRELDSVAEALRRMRRRISRQVDLATGVDVFTARSDEFRADFHELFVDLVALER